MFTPRFLLISLAVFLLTVYLPALANPKKFRKAMKSFFYEENAVRNLGFSSLLLAMMFLSVNWKLQNDWIVIISILGWVSLVKGLIMIWSPSTIKRIIKKSSLFNSDTGIAILSIIGVIAAALLIYLGTDIITLGEIVSE